MCDQSISNSSDLHIDIVKTIDDHIDNFDEIGIL